MEATARDGTHQAPSVAVELDQSRWMRSAELQISADRDVFSSALLMGQDRSEMYAGQLCWQATCAARPSIGGS